MKTLSLDKLDAAVKRTLTNCKKLKDKGAPEKDMLPLLIKLDTLVTLAGLFEEVDTIKN